MDVNKLFSQFSSQFPSLKSEVIYKAINNFNCDHDKIKDFLLSHSFEESISVSKKSSLDSIKSPGYLSFGSFTSDSLESDSNSPAYSRNHYRNSNELSTISSQISDVNRLQDEYFKMQNNMEYLKNEMKYLKEISNKRKSVPYFPSVVELENLDRIVNKKYSMLPKSVSYANDLRKPEEMNSRYKGFQQPYNQFSELINKNNNPHININNNNAHNNRINSDNTPFQDSFNSNFLKPQNINNNLLFPLNKHEEKRNSAHFADNFQLPEELIGHPRGHYRQKSDPWILESLGCDSNLKWTCSKCNVSNISSKCSRCLRDRIQSVLKNRPSYDFTDQILKCDKILCFATENSNKIHELLQSIRSALNRISL